LLPKVAPAHGAPATAEAAIRAMPLGAAVMPVAPAFFP